MALGDEVVVRNDPEEEPEEEEEEEDLIDPVDELRTACENNPTALALAERLEQCNSRVSSREHTEENCSEEMIDWVHQVDTCVSKDLFSKLK